MTFDDGYQADKARLQEQYTQAIEAMGRRSFSIRRAAEKFGLSKSSLHREMQKRKRQACAEQPNE